jgi:hypothetical protein
MLGAAVMRLLLSLSTLCLCMGCATSRTTIDAGLVASPEVAKAVQSSFSFQRARSIDRSRAVWFVEGEDRGSPVVYVGFDMGTHTCRHATLRAREHGTVEREEMLDDGELIWVPDR